MTVTLFVINSHDGIKNIISDADNICVCRTHMVMAAMKVGTWGHGMDLHKTTGQTRLVETFIWLGHGRTHDIWL